MISHRVFLWGPFLVISFLTLLVSWKLTWIDSYFWVLTVLGLLSAICAARVLRHTGLTLRSVAYVAVILVVGQWWLIQLVAVYIIWTIRGFAP